MALRGQQGTLRKKFNRVGGCETVVALADENIDDFIRAVRIAQAGLASDALKGGTS